VGASTSGPLPMPSSSSFYGTGTSTGTSTAPPPAAAAAGGGGEQPVLMELIIEDYLPPPLPSSTSTSSSTTTTTTTSSSRNHPSKRQVPLHHHHAPTPSHKLLSTREPSLESEGPHDGPRALSAQHTARRGEVLFGTLSPPLPSPKPPRCQGGTLLLLLLLKVLSMGTRRRTDAAILFCSLALHDGGHAHMTWAPRRQDEDRGSSSSSSSRWAVVLCRSRGKGKRPEGRRTGAASCRR
jgi:hypothetical protein